MTANLENLAISDFSMNGANSLRRSMRSLFRELPMEIKTLRIENCTSGVESLVVLLGNLYHVESIAIKNFNSGRLNNTKLALLESDELQYLDISELDTSNVTDMTSMFNGCRKIKELDLTNFNTSKVTSMQKMFKGCTSLERIDLSNFDTSNVKTFESMFETCLSLKHLDLSSFEFCKYLSAESYKGIFDGCISLKTVVLPKHVYTRRIVERELIERIKPLDSDLTFIR